MFSRILSTSFFLCLLMIIGCEEAHKPDENTMILSGTVKGLRKGTLYLQKIQDILIRKFHVHVNICVAYPEEFLSTGVRKYSTSPLIDLP